MVAHEDEALQVATRSIIEVWENTTSVSSDILVGKRRRKNILVSTQ
jgi:hypothetical protein